MIVFDFGARFFSDGLGMAASGHFFFIFVLVLRASGIEGLHVAILCNGILVGRGVE